MSRSADVERVLDHPAGCRKSRSRIDEVERASFGARDRETRPCTAAAACRRTDWSSRRGRDSAAGRIDEAEIVEQERPAGAVGRVFDDQNHVIDLTPVERRRSRRSRRADSASRVVHPLPVFGIERVAETIRLFSSFSSIAHHERRAQRVLHVEPELLDRSVLQAAEAAIDIHACRETAPARAPMSGGTCGCTVVLTVLGPKNVK